VGQIDRAERSGNGENDHGTEIPVWIPATPGVEVKNLAFASDEVVWISWKYGAVEDVPIRRYTYEVKGD